MFPQAVLFDFGGTLDADGVTWLDRFLPLYARHAGRQDPSAVSRAFHDADDNLARRFPLAGLGLEQTLLLQVQCVLEGLGGGRERQAVVAGFLEASRRHLARSRALVRRLREGDALGGRRVAVGIVSNFYGNLDSVLESEGFGGLFDVIADSGRVGALKPDPRIFRYALDFLGTDPARTWMVGDSLERDMRGAERSGLPHAWLRGSSPGRASPAPCCAGAAVLERLEDLETVLRERVCLAP